MSNFLSDDFQLDVQREPVDTGTLRRDFSVGFLKGNSFSPENQVLIKPDIVGELVKNQVVVRVERKIGASAFIDLDYADVGAEIEDDADEVISHSNIIVKLAPLTSDELILLKNKQIIISYTDLSSLSSDDILVLQQKKITAISLDKALDSNGKHLINNILSWKVDAAIQCDALGNYILSLLFALIYNTYVRYAVQMNPALLQTIYCYQGVITDKQLGEKYQLYWKDILLLCWNWN